MNLAKNYEPNQYESDIYALWEGSGAFTPKKASNKDSFTIVMPPPNANANLHLGHALTGAIEDIMVRYQRMKGKQTLLLPGADHAGFETQSVYEKHLAKAGKSRFDFTRDELYGQIWDFVAENRENFEKQVRAIGVSADWSRYTFTLDPQIIDQAYKTFKKMWDEGLIYRGERLVNYCTYHGTGFADVEVVHKNQQGHIWSLRYPLTDGSGSITVATTRPETMLGDTAVAVHPSDERYKAYIGKTVTLPLTNREVPIIADDYVDPEFGTGAVKITPAHDVNDFEIGQRHTLPMIQVIDHHGKINSHAPEAFRGLTVKQARDAVVKALDQVKALVAIKEHENNVGHCYKCDTVIEPMLKEQWFINMQPLAQRAIEALKAEKITFYPDTRRTQLINYLENLRDWNISRQIAWGVPIPAYQNLDDPEDWIFNQDTEKEEITVGDKRYRRDPDVFDTWFTSSSWPYATLNEEEKKQFYPNSLMETGGEILQPWVSRMIMLGLYELDEVPFREVYIHGYVMAEDGSKMSKSVGNVVDPMPVIEKYGSDALRMGLIAGRTAGVNRGYDSRRVEEARNFCNKLWNIARFIEGKLDDSKVRKATAKPETIADHWILAKLDETTRKIDAYLSEHRFSEGYEALYHFVWDDLADWYIESSKSALNGSILAYTLTSVLKIAHPFAPFVTETIWQTLHQNDESLLITEQWSQTANFDKHKADSFEKVKVIVSEIRHIKTELKIRKGNLYHTKAPFSLEQADLVKSLAQLDHVTEVEDGRGLELVSANGECWLDIDHDTLEQFTVQIKRKIEDINKQIDTLQIRLNNESYISRAPAKLVQQSKDQLATLQDEKGLLYAQLEKYDRR